MVGAYRAAGIQHVVLMIDPLNPYNRGADVGYGRTLTDPAVQLAYRSFVVGLVSDLQPDWVGFACETRVMPHSMRTAPRDVWVRQRANPTSCTGDDTEGAPNVGACQGYAGAALETAATGKPRVRASGGAPSAWPG